MAKPKFVYSGWTLHFFDDSMLIILRFYAFLDQVTQQTFCNVALLHRNLPAIIFRFAHQALFHMHNNELKKNGIEIMRCNHKIDAIF